MLESIRIAFQVARLAKEVIPVIKDIIHIVQGVDYTQKNAQGHDAKTKKAHCKIKLQESGIDESKYNELDKGIDFVKDIMKKNNVFGHFSKESNSDI